MYKFGAHVYYGTLEAIQPRKHGKHNKIEESKDSSYLFFSLYHITLLILTKNETFSFTFNIILVQK